MADVSIVLPTYNRQLQLQQVLVGLERQSYPANKFEVIVVSDGSTDGTNEYLQQLRNQTKLALNVVVQANQGPSAARNCGIQLAMGEIVLFLDDDVVPVPELIAQHMATHAEFDEDVVVIGPMLTPLDFDMKPWVRWEQAMLDKQYTDAAAAHWESSARKFYTGNASLMRRHLLDANGFDTNFRRSEDVELAYRLAEQGIKFIFNPHAIGYHYAERSFASWLQTPYMYGRNDVICARDKGHSWLLPTIGREFHSRHSFTKLLARLCISRRTANAAAITVLRHVAEVGSLIGWEWIPQRAYSGIFNLRHYQGVTDELGGRQQFFHLIAQAAESGDL